MSDTDTFQSLDSLDQLLAAARREGLELDAEGATFDTMGLDFVVAHARDRSGTPWIVRSPRRPDVRDAARHEARVLAAVAPALQAVGVAVPVWRVHADDVIAYARIAGTPAVTMPEGAPTWNIIDPAAPSEVFVDSFARALATMQTLPDDRAAGIRRTSIADERAALAKTLETARPLLEPKEAVWTRWQRWLEDDSSWPAHVALVHGDLHPGHMLLDDTGHLVGILDWTEARITDPSIDFAMFHMGFGRAALESLIARYAAHGGRTWPRMAEHAIERSAVFPALGAEWAARTGNEAALAFSRAKLAEL